MPNNHLQSRFDSVTAPNGARFNAFTVDGVFAAALSQLVLTLVHTLFKTDIDFFATLVISVLYYAVPLAITGQTLGKKIFGLRVLPNEENRNLNFKEALIRETFGKFLSYVSFFGLVMVYFREDHRALHDLVSKTIVVQDSAVAEKNKSFIVNFLRSTVVTVIVTIASLAYISRSSIFADQLEARLTAQGIKVQKVSGNLAQGFHFQNLEINDTSGTYRIGSADLQFGNYLKIFTEGAFTVRNFTLTDSEVKMKAGDANQVFFGLIAATFFGVSKEGLSTSGSKVTFKKAIIENLELTNCKIKDATKSLELTALRFTGLTFDFDDKSLSWNAFTVRSSLFDLDTKQVALSKGSIKSSDPVMGKIYFLPEAKLKVPIDAVATFDFENQKLNRLQVNAFENKLTLTSETDKPFQLWVSSLEIKKYFEQIPFDSLSFYSTNKDPISLATSSPETLQIKLGAANFAYSKQNSSIRSQLEVDAVASNMGSETHLLLPPGFISGLLAANSKSQLYDLKGSSTEQILSQLGISYTSDIANRFTSATERTPASR